MNKIKKKKSYLEEEDIDAEMNLVEQLISALEETNNSR
jgi:hypothetical protein